jgi:flagellar motor switch protein FliN/FliY
MTIAVAPDTEALLAAAAPVSAALPVAGGLQPRPVDSGTALGPDPAAAGWVSVRQALTLGRTLVLAVAAPLAESGDVSLPEVIAAVAGSLGVDTEGTAEVVPAAESLAGVETGTTVSAIALGSDDLDMGLLVLISPEGVSAPAGPPSAPPLPSMQALAAELPMAGITGSARIDLLHAVDMEVTCELGRSRMTVRELLALRPGAVVELDRAAGSPVDLLINGTLFARGEVVVIDEEYGVRVTEIVGPDQAGADAA